MKNWTDLLLQFLLGLHRSPSSPVSSIAGDGKGSGEGPVWVNKLKTPLFSIVFCLCNPFLCYCFVIGGKKQSKMAAIGYQNITFTRLT